MSFIEITLRNRKIKIQRKKGIKRLYKKKLNYDDANNDDMTVMKTTIMRVLVKVITTTTITIIDNMNGVITSQVKKRMIFIIIFITYFSLIPSVEISMKARKQLILISDLTTMFLLLHSLPGECIYFPPLLCSDLPICSGFGEHIFLFHFLLQ